MEYTGLTSAEVKERVEQGKVNADAGTKTRTIPQILRDNICTLFNLVNIIIAAAIAWTGAYRNMLFLGVIVLNVAIGIIQEIRSKRTIDKLSVITSTKARAYRDGELLEIPIDQIVLDDVIRLRRGDQVPSDCVVLEGRASANESLLTGESDQVSKAEGDTLFSGSFISMGTCVARVIAVGEDNYATRINNEAKVFKKAHSDIMAALKSIIKWVTVGLVPIGALLMVKEVVFAGGTVQDAILHTSAALIGMIPQGLILLTSAVFAVSVVRLAQRKVLVQELFCVENLARVDVVCLDKTGTITTGEMDVDELVAWEDSERADALRALAAIDASVSEDTANETSRAIRTFVAGEEGADAPTVACVREIPFSSDTKYSGADYGEAGCFCMGAAEFVLRDCPQLPAVQAVIAEQAGPRRVLVIARVDGFDEQGRIAGEVEPIGLLFIVDRVRATARQTLQYFTDQGVRINIISGDSVDTVRNIALSVGVPDADRCIDMTGVTTPEQLAEAARDCRVFCRVSPEQKKLLVKELQAQGHTVAMTGDGVNDVLALQAADCGVAMGSGSDAARNIAQLILMDDDFASMPAVVAEGRRSINNLQRSGSLFLVKTLFSACLAVLFIIIQAYAYPFVTIQLTLISALTIGLPSFVLALEPNHELVRGNFLRNVVTFALPGAIMVVASVLISCICGAILGLGQEQFSTLCVILSAVAGLNLCIRLSMPFNPIRIALLAVIVIGLAGGIFLFPAFFSLAPFTTHMTIIAVSLVVVVTVVFNLLYNLARKNQRSYLERL